MAPVNKNFLRDSIYHSVPECNCDAEYARGNFVGVVSGMMACGYTFDKALELVAEALHEMGQPIRRECVPGSWRPTLMRLNVRMVDKKTD